MVIAANNFEPVSGSLPASLPSPIQTNYVSPWKKVMSVAEKVFDMMTKTIWPYIKNVGNIIGKGLKIVVLKCPKLELKMGHIISKIGLLSGISCLLMIKTVQSNILSLIKNSQIHDTEGIISNAISLAINPFETLDSAITFTGYLSSLNVIPMIGFFSLIGTPLAAGINGYCAIKEGYNTVRCGINLHELPKTVDAENMDSLKVFIQKKIDVTEEEKRKIETSFQEKNPQMEVVEIQKGIARKVSILKDRKTNILARHTDTKIVNIMKNLKRYLDKKHANVKTANKALRDMKKLMIRKIIFGSLSSLASLALGVALAVSLFFQMSPIVLPIVVAAKTLFFLAKHHFQHVWMDRGLEHRKFLIAS